MKTYKARLLSALFLSMFIFFFDQFMKCWVVANFWYFVNTGFSWGFFQDNNFAASLISIIIMILFFTLFYRMIITESIMRFILVSFLSASCSNLFDRIMRGGVVDYISLWGLPSFNLADIIITVSIIILFIWFVRYEKKFYSSGK